MIVVALDPGSEETGFVVFTGDAFRQHGIVPNTEMRARLRAGMLDESHVVVIERVEGFGKIASREEFRTAEWGGVFYEAASVRLTESRVSWLTRREVKLHVTGVANANDRQIREVLLDRFPQFTPPTGKGARSVDSLKSHEWAALALAVTWSDRASRAAAETTQSASTTPSVEPPSVPIVGTSSGRSQGRWDF